MDFPRRGAAAAAAAASVAAAAAAAAAALLHTTTCMTGGRKEAKEMGRHERSTIFLTAQETYQNNAKNLQGKVEHAWKKREGSKHNTYFGGRFFVFFSVPKYAQYRVTV